MYGLAREVVSCQIMTWEDACNVAKIERAYNMNEYLLMDTRANMRKLLKEKFPKGIFSKQEERAIKRQVVERNVELMESFVLDFGIFQAAGFSGQRCPSPLKGLVALPEVIAMAEALCKK